MRKLKLSLESLDVESFQVADEAHGRGTVEAHLQYTDPRVCSTDVDCQSLNYSNCATCDSTCVGTCLGQYTCEALDSCDPWAC